MLFSPGDTLDGLNAFFFDVEPDSPVVEDADLDGWLYLASTAVVDRRPPRSILARRYRTIGT